MQRAPKRPRNPTAFVAARRRRWARTRLACSSEADELGEDPFTKAVDGATGSRVSQDRMARGSPRRIADSGGNYRTSARRTCR